MSNPVAAALAEPGAGGRRALYYQQGPRRCRPGRAGGCHAAAAARAEPADSARFMTTNGPVAVAPAEPAGGERCPRRASGQGERLCRCRPGRAGKWRAPYYQERTRRHPPSRRVARALRP